MAFIGVLISLGVVFAVWLGFFFTCLLIWFLGVRMKRKGKHKVISAIMIIIGASLSISLVIITIFTIGMYTGKIK